MKLCNWISKTGTRCVVLVSEDRKYNRILTMGSIPRVLKISKEEKLRTVPFSKKNNVKRFCKFAIASWIRAGKQTISKEAKTLLKGSA